MDLRTDYPFWLLDKGIIRSYPSLDEDIRTDVVVMGAGISGALSAWYLVQAGFDVVVVDKRHVGMGSTAASTALLQYEIDTPLRELIGKVGQKNAVLSYRLCLDAIEELGTICKRFPEAGFLKKPSFQYASTKKDVPDLRAEYALRRQQGIALQWLDAADVHNRFTFDKPAGLLSRAGAEVKAYNLCHELLGACIRRGARVFDHTEIDHFQEHPRGVQLRTVSGHVLKAKKLVIACGYESAKYIPKKVQEIQSTYAIVSEPMQSKKIWYRNALIWETARPYLYLRTTNDHRILVGGKDDDFADPRLRAEALPRKARALEKAFRKLFPDIDFRTDFKWAGAFASTKDGLPYIGSLPGQKHTYFALGFGGNGITFSVIAGQIISRLAAGLECQEAAVFSFSR